MGDRFIVRTFSLSLNPSFIMKDKEHMQSSSIISLLTLIQKALPKNESRDSRSSFRPPKSFPLYNLWSWVINVAQQMNCINGMNSRKHKSPFPPECFKSFALLFSLWQKGWNLSQHCFPKESSQIPLMHSPNLCGRVQMFKTAKNANSSSYSSSPDLEIYQATCEHHPVSFKETMKYCLLFERESTT